MFAHPGNHLGDTWYFVDGDKLHMFYLTCPQSVERHTAWDIGHAVSTDLYQWEICDKVLSRGLPDEFDGLCPATGSVIKALGRYWMAYTGNWCGPVPSVGMCVSDDLYHWDKIKENPVTTIDSRYYAAQPISGARNWLHWRDPFMFRCDDKIYHYVCAMTKQHMGTVGMAVTDNMVEWEVLPPPEVEPITQELECPQVYKNGDKYYLLFSSCTSFFSEKYKLLDSFRKERWTAFSMLGDSMKGPFRLYNNGIVIPEDYPVQPYAVQLVFWKEKAYVFGTLWDEKGDIITDPIPVTFTDEGIKVLKF